MTPIPLPVLVPPVIPGHHVIDPGAPMWLRWSFDPEFLIPTGFLVWWYFRGLRRWPARSHEHPWWRTALYVGGVVTLVIALESPIDSLSETYFTFHMIQHLLLMLVGPPLILLGAPTTPSLRGMPRWLRMGVIRRLARRRTVRLAYGWITHPVIAVGVMTAILWLWHLAPGWYDGALQHPMIHDLEHFSMVASATLFWWNAIDPKPLRSRLGYLARILYIAGAAVPMEFLSAMLALVGHPLYQTYTQATGTLPLTPLVDQELGGLIMWVPGMFIYLAAAGVVFAVWARRSEALQREIEAEADRLRAAAQPAAEV